MSCLCATNTLRLFLRSIVQLDLPASTIAANHSRNLAIRRHSGRAIRELHSTPKRLDSSRITLPGDDIQSGNGVPGSSQVAVELRKERHPVEKSADGADSAFAELSPQSIDDIAAELATERDSITSQAESFSTPGHMSTGRGGVSSKTTFRKTKVQTRSLAIHYSSPRTPGSAPAESHKASKSDDNKPEKSASKDEWITPPREPWQIYKEALKKKLPDGWNPRKRLSPDALAGIRALHAQMPEVYTCTTLAASFQVSPDAIRRILKSKWSPDAEEETDRQRRWFNRGKQIYAKHAAMGQKPPRKWRDLGIGKGKPAWKTGKQTKAPLPALITTTRRAPPTTGVNYEDGLADRIL
jgi:hypothetical protein